MPSTTTALQAANSALRQSNLDEISTLISNSNTPFPDKIVLDCLNMAIREMNRKGRFWFMESAVVLPYSVGVSSYTFDSLGSVDPKGVLRIRREMDPLEGELVQQNYRWFQQRYRQQPILTQMPRAWTKFGNTLYLDSIPDQNYTLTMYCLKDIPIVTADNTTFPCQESDVDVFIDGLMAYLHHRTSNPDYAQVYQLWMSKVNALIADMAQDAGMPTQMPAAW
jgi:hypothetical protein